MKLHKIASGILIGSIVLTQSVFAQGFQQGPGNDRNDARGGSQQQRQNQRPNQQPNQQNSGPQHGSQVAPNRGSQQPMARHDGRGAGPQQSWYKGDRLPSDYRGRQYVVDNWRDHHLKQPPRGYHWVQVGGDYVLAAITTGIIMQILLNN